MGKSWIDKDRRSVEYITGIDTLCDQSRVLVSTLQNLVNDTLCHQRSHKSRMSGDALSVLHALVNNIQREPSSSKHINVEPSKQQPPKNIQYLSKPSNHPTKIRHLTPGGRTPEREQLVNGDGRPTPGEETPTLGGTSIQGGTPNQKRTIMGMNNTDQGNSKRPKSNMTYEK